MYIAANTMSFVFINVINVFMKGLMRLGNHLQGLVTLWNHLKGPVNHLKGTKVVPWKML